MGINDWWQSRYNVPRGTGSGGLTDADVAAALAAESTDVGYEDVMLYDNNWNPIGLLKRTPSGTAYIQPPPGLTAQQAIQWSAQVAGNYRTESGHSVTLNSRGQVVNQRVLREGELGGGPGGGGGGEDPSIGRAFAAAEAEKQRAWEAEQNRLDRERQERQARLSALMENLQFINSIQPDLAGFGAALNSVPLQGTTPTIGYGNAIQENINTLQGQLASPPPVGTPIPTTPAPSLAGTGAAQGMIANPMQLGTTKRGVLVGDREINGDEELLTMDPATGQVEVIPIVGRAAEGATFNFADYGMNTADWDTTSLYGALSPLYQPFGITSAGAVPTKANAAPTSLGYIQPTNTTDFSTTQPAAYGPLSRTYFEKNTGMLLPNPSTILRELRVLKAQNPVAYATALSFYANATTQDGKPSGLPPEAIDTMIENAAIQGRSGNFSIGLR